MQFVFFKNSPEEKGFNIGKNGASKKRGKNQGKQCGKNRIRSKKYDRDVEQYKK